MGEPRGVRHSLPAAHSQRLTFHGHGVLRTGQEVAPPYHEVVEVGIPEPVEDAGVLRREVVHGAPHIGRGDRRHRSGDGGEEGRAADDEGDPRHGELHHTGVTLTP